MIIYLSILAGAAIFDSNGNQIGEHCFQNLNFDTQLPQTTE